MIFLSSLLLPFVVKAQNIDNYTANQIAKQVASKLCKSINPNTCSNAGGLILAHSTEGDLDKLYMVTQWQGASCGMCETQWYTTYENVYVNRYGQIENIEITSKTANVDQVWSSSGVTAVLAGLIVASTAVSSYSSNNPSNNSSYSNNNDYINGTTGYFDMPFTQGGNVLVQNKYRVRLFLKITGSGTSNDGKPAYECYCYNAEVQIDGNFASPNELNSFEDAKQTGQKHIDKLLYKTLTIPKADFKK